MKIKYISLWVFCLILVWGVCPSQAIDLTENLSLSGYVKNETYIRAWHGPNDIMSCRNVLNFDVTYHFPSSVPLFKRFFIQLRPFYDAVFDLENDGTGGASRGRRIRGREYLERFFAGEFFIANPLLQDRHIRQKFEHNFGRADDWDPLVRECWVELEAGELGDLSMRLGRQLVSWGRSDGIYLLDLINPFNSRNWSVFEEEDTKIPLWMANVTYSFSAFNSLQLLIIPRYVPGYSPGDGHDWTPNITEFVDNIVADPAAFLGLPPGLLGSSLVVWDEPDWTEVSNWEWGLKWGGLWKGLTYSLNIFYTWKDFLTDYPQDPFNTVIKRNADRLTVIGGSFDYAFDDALWMENWVLRGEAAYFRNDVFYDHHGLPLEKDNIAVLLGYDKQFFVDYSVSLQCRVSYILDSDHWHNPYGNVSLRYKETVTIPGVGPVPITEGYRDTMETDLSLYIMKWWLPGDTLYTDLFALWTDEGDWWVRSKVRYEVTDRFYASVGCNLYWGSGHDTFGQFNDNDNIFFELKHDF